MAGKLASLIIKISANGAEAEKELRKLERKMSDFSKNLKKLGTDMSKYITAPITAMAGVSVAAANTQLQAEAKLLNALQGRSDVQQRLIKQAGELQSRSTLGDEAIIEQQAYLAALGLSEKQIGSTIEAAAQLSAALDIDLGSAVKNLAKTYGGMTGELGESIPALKNLTKEQLQAGDAIKYVNDNYKGFAEIAASTGTGPLTQLKNIVGDIAESFGVILLPAIQKFAAKLKELALAFQQLSPEIKETIVTVAAIVAAIGPAIIVFSKMLTAVKLVSLAMPALGAAMTAAAAGPIAAITAGVLALASAWLLAKDRATAYKALEEGRKQGASDRQQEAYDRAMKQYGGASKAELEKQIAEWTEMRDREAAYYISASGGRMTQQQVDALVVYDGTLNALKEILETRKEEERVIKSINDALKNTESIVVKTKQELSTIDVGGADLSTLSAVPSINLDTYDQHLSESIGKTTAIADFREYWENLRKEAEKARSVGEEIATVISTTFANMATALGEGLGDLFTGGDFDLGKTFLEVLGKSLQQLGAALITYATAMESFKKSLSVIFNNPGLAIIAGLAAIATGKAFVNLANTPPKLASGGLVYGPTLAVVGDNRGAASDPEVIAPLSKLRNYLGGQQLQLVGGVSFELRGDVVRAVLDRENFRLNRKG
jgi:putative intracellular protease/amidase